MRTRVSTWAHANYMRGGEREREKASGNSHSRTAEKAAPLGCAWHDAGGHRESAENTSLTLSLSISVVKHFFPPTKRACEAGRSDWALMAVAQTTRPCGHVCARRRQFPYPAQVKRPFNCEPGSAQPSSPASPFAPNTPTPSPRGSAPAALHAGPTTAVVLASGLLIARSAPLCVH
jgi:hypothetical protein